MSAALDSFAPSIAHLRTIATPAADYRVMPFGVEALDSRLGAGGLRAGALHEATARSAALVDDAATTLFLAGIAAREAADAGGPVLWATCRADLYAPALEQAGLPSANVIYAQPRDDAALLAVVEDAVRDGTPAAIVAEASKISMVATRRLQLVRPTPTCRCCCFAGCVGPAKTHSLNPRPHGRAGGSAQRRPNGWRSREWEGRGGRWSAFASVGVRGSP